MVVSIRSRTEGSTVVENVHERHIAATPDEVWAVLHDLDLLYPPSSGSFRLPEGLHPGAPVIHDGTRYRIAEVVAGRRLWFDVGRSMSDGHGFELIPHDGGTLVRHSITGHLSGWFAVLWPVMIRRQHNRAMSGTLDNLKRAVEGPSADLPAENAFSGTRGARGRVRRWVGGGEVPPVMAGLSTLSGHDYIDAFRLDVSAADRWTAESWARAMFEDDRPVAARAVTRGLLGAMLSRTAPQGRVGGFTVVHASSATLRGEAHSTLTTDQVTVHVGADEVTLVTAVRFHRAVAGPMWATLSHLHRRFAPQILRYAAAQLERSSRPVDQRRP